MHKKCYAITTAAIALLFIGGCSKTDAPTPVGTAPGPATSAVEDSYGIAIGTRLALSAAKDGGRCFVDSFNGQTVKPRNEVSKATPLTIDGWAVDAANNGSPLTVIELVALDGSKKYYGPAQRASRPGLGQALGKPDLDKAALQSTASLKDVNSGDYAIKIIVGDESAANRCDPNILLVVK